MKVRDPVCGMTIEDTEAAGNYAYEGRTYYFCSPSCLVEFQKDPKVYLHKKEADSGAAGPSDETDKKELKEETSVASCPTCGGEFLPDAPHIHTGKKTEWTCPMHPQIVRDAPGSCPICGMALEPRTLSLEEEENPELLSMTRRFWTSAVLTVPLVLIGMRMALPGSAALVYGKNLDLLELILATPVVLWGGWPFFVRGWQSIVNRSPNMFTLIGLGVAVAYGYSVVAALFPGVFPASFRLRKGGIGTYFEAAAAITTLVLLGQVLELRARSRTGAAIKSLLGLAPKNRAARERRRGGRYSARSGEPRAICCACAPARRSP